MKEVIEFVKVKDTIFDLRSEFNHGCLYLPVEGSLGVFSKIYDESILMHELSRGNVYREVARIAIWKDYAIEIIKSDDAGVSDLESNVLCNIINNKPQLMIELSHLVASITDNPR